jgi:hypothetical protein
MIEQFGWRVAENCPDTTMSVAGLLETGTSKAFKEQRSFYLTDLFAEMLPKGKLPVFCVAIFL